ncbi:hypothetical protein EX895_001966 [Sporisorium graminicola]|uniref:Uncharacterized protein n=1 Tax=Sporisorium graminicola TaxID=280036 RepID=A0A4U7KXB3_9BASI|nr:hypothetical protein EX895_001966 [Sporisorium graminicola]TKY89435.1 hypothetical protein EX895_001966 [Sporisorium graminicola]
MSFAPLPAPGTAASSSIWARRMITKSVPTTDAEVELNVLSLLLDVPIESLDDAQQQQQQQASTAPVSPFCAQSPWSPLPLPVQGANTFEAVPAGATSPALLPVQRSRSAGGYFNESLEMHAAQTAVKAALDVLEEPSLSCGLRISTSTSSNSNSNVLGLTAPLSPALSSPTSPAESCFSEGEGAKKKGRARMSQEKRKRLARRREREALVVALSQQPEAASASQQQHLQQQQFGMQTGEAYFVAHTAHLSRSAPVTPMCSYFPTTHGSSGFGGFPFAASPSPSSYHATPPSYEAVAAAAMAFSSPLSSPRTARFHAGTDLPSPALTHASSSPATAYGSVGTPSSSPTSAAVLRLASDPQSSPPTLVIQPPSPQRTRSAAPGAYAKRADARWIQPRMDAEPHWASVY